MSTKTQHTALPWEFNSDRDELTIHVRGGIIASIFTPDSSPCFAPDDPAEEEAVWCEVVANGTFIVECVNSHAALTARVAKLEDALSQIASDSATAPYAHAVARAALQQLRKAEANPMGYGGAMNATDVHEQFNAHNAFYATPDPAEAPEPHRQPWKGKDAVLVLVAAISLGVLCWYWPAAHGWFAAHAERWRAF